MKLLLLSFFALLSMVNAQADDCDACIHIKFEASGGLQDEYSRYMGTWNKVGIWEGKAFYTCSDCQGLRDQMIYVGGKWQIVDCRPDAPGACGGTHYLISSSPAPATSCPYDNIAPWDYCTGDILAGGGCTAYDEDITAQFVCV